MCESIRSSIMYETCRICGVTISDNIMITLIGPPITHTRFYNLPTISHVFYLFCFNILFCVGSHFILFCSLSFCPFFVVARFSPTLWLLWHLPIYFSHEWKNVIPKGKHSIYYYYYTLSEAWSGVNWADLMAAQGAFGTDFYDRFTRTIVREARCFGGIIDLSQ